MEQLDSELPHYKGHAALDLKSYMGAAVVRYSDAR